MEPVASAIRARGAARDEQANDSPVSEGDGRHARRDRNKVAVVDAYLDLVREGSARPSVGQVAERSGVSRRSVFRYFADKDELARTAIERQQSRVAPLYRISFDPTAPLDERIEQVLDQRMQLYETVGPVARLTRALAPVQPIIDVELGKTRALLRSHLERVFGVELATMPSPSAAMALSTIDVVCSFETFDLLRSVHGLSLDDTHACVRHLLRQALVAPPEADPST